MLFIWKELTPSDALRGDDGAAAETRDAPGGCLAAPAGLSQRPATAPPVTDRPSRAGGGSA